MTATQCRSWLFVPGDSEKKLEKAIRVGADCLIVDLEDAVAPDRKAVARDLARDWLKTYQMQVTRHRFARWVRINALDTPYWQDDLIKVMAGAPDGIMIPKATGPDQLRNLAAEIYELEQIHEIPVNSTKLLPLVSETAGSALSIADWARNPVPRLAGLTWGAEDLSAAIGARRRRSSQGEWTDLFRYVRTQTLLTAHAAGIMPVETLHSDFSDLDAVRYAAEIAYVDGFTGMLAIHPAQVPVINEAFSPTEDEIAEAQRIVDLFAANPGAGTLQMDGLMLDRPHLALAKRVLGISDNE